MSFENSACWDAASRVLERHWIFEHRWPFSSAQAMLASTSGAIDRVLSNGDSDDKGWYVVVLNLAEAEGWAEGILGACENAFLAAQSGVPLLHGGGWGSSDDENSSDEDSSDEEEQGRARGDLAKKQGGGKRQKRASTADSRSADSRSAGIVPPLPRTAFNSIAALKVRFFKLSSRAAPQVVRNMTHNSFAAFFLSSARGAAEDGARSLSVARH